MDLVLGLSITSAAVRFVLVEGSTGDGDTLDHDVIDIATVRAAGALGARDLADVLLGDKVVEAAREGTLHSIGVTWTDTASAEGSMVLGALAAAGFDDFIAVSECDAVAALATGIQSLAGSDDIAVCVIEPEAVAVAIIESHGAFSERFDRPLDGGDAAELVHRLVPILRPQLGSPEAVFVLGSAHDLDLILTSLKAEVISPVVSAADADVAMARGAALAAAWAISGVEAQIAATAVPDDLAVLADAPALPHRHRRPKSRVGALTSVLVAAVLTFVVSVSVALGLRLTPTDNPGDEQPSGVAAASGGEPAMALPPVARPAPHAPPPIVPPPAAAPVEAPPPAQTPAPVAAAIAPEAAPLLEAAPSAPAFEPPAAAPAAPPPVYAPMEPAPVAAAVPAAVPPAPPAPAPESVPADPAQTVPDNSQPAPQPRLRDRIIERIPIVNRFHDPQPQSP